MLYSEYLKTNHWEKTRNKKLRQSPNCGICDTDQKIHIHHKRYKYDPSLPLAKRHGAGSILFRERKTDLMVLCSSCHALWHRYIKYGRKLNKWKMRIRSLLSLNVDKKMAFYIVGHSGMWESLYGRIKNGSLQKHLARGLSKSKRYDDYKQQVV